MYNDLVTQDVDNPKYLFYGCSKYGLDSIVPKDNEGIVLLPSIELVAPYAFIDSIKENSKGLDCKITIPNNNEYPFMIIEDARIDENISGYIYAFLKEETMIKDNDSYVYRCNEEIVPYAVFQASFDHFVKNYQIKNN